MGETVYLLGAGLNQVVEDWDGLSPPLLKNFFNIALCKRKFRNDHYSRKIQDVYDYIAEFFKKTKDDLAKSSFDLELCFTLLERQIKRAAQERRITKLKELLTIRFHLASFLAKVLSEFEHFAMMSHTMRNFGRVIFHERPSIVTFNYDCLMESVLEFASGVNISIPESFRDSSRFEETEVPDELLTYSHHNWNKPLGYGFKFDAIQLQQAGVSRYVAGSRFYSLPENQLYSKPLLKLHGSLNWFKYTSTRSYPVLPEEPEPELGEKASETILKDGTWWFGRPPDHNGWFIVPVIITPVLYKDEYFDEKPFREIWELAKKVLSECDKLVVIGYSFSPSDFPSRQLLLESFAENDLEELVIVNPNHNLVKVVKDLCHFHGGVVWYSGLDEYLQTYSESVAIESKPIEIPEEDLPEDTSPHDLYVKCKTCGVEFPAGIRTNPRSFATSTYIGNIHRCPNGHANSYDKGDYTLRKVENQ